MIKEPVKRTDPSSLVICDDPLPTHRAVYGNKGGPNQAGSKGDLMLPSAAAQWPTPMTVNTTSNRAKYGRETSGPSRGGARFGLEDIANTWPTPAARDSKGANSAEHALITGGGAQAHGPTEQLCRPFFAPGPADARWPSILREWPGLAPALDKTAQSGLRGVADGLASGMDDCRAQRLKCVGNGVVALCAATAFVMLARRAGFMTNQPPALVKTAQAATKPVAEMEII